MRKPSVPGKSPQGCWGSSLMPCDVPYCYSHVPAANIHPICSSKQKQSSCLQDSNQRQLGPFLSPSCFASKQHTLLWNSRLSHRGETGVNGSHLCRLGTVSFPLTSFGPVGSFWGTRKSACLFVPPGDVRSRAAASNMEQLNSIPGHWTDAVLSPPPSHLCTDHRCSRSNKFF